RTLWESGTAHVRMGNTTTEELRRVASAPAADNLKHPARASRLSVGNPMSDSPISLDIGTIECYIVHPQPDGWRVLLMQRGEHTIRPGSWEVVTGSIEAGERPEDAAMREVQEETGLLADRLYCVAVQSFYLPRRSSIQMSLVFAAFVDHPGAVVLNDEHRQFEWLAVDAARERCTWPRSRRSIGDIVELLGPGNIERVQDVLRVR
ncbi:MAG: NUDIX hydrolase, partial [Gemmatimonadaceae bacterium]